MSERRPSEQIVQLEEYIAGLMRLLPEDLKEQVRALNRRPVAIEHQVACAQLHISQAMADLEQLREETQLLRDNIAGIMDMAQLARLIGPIVDILHGDPSTDSG